jgi:SAM-dependent methyltransferase
VLDDQDGADGGGPAARCPVCGSATTRRHRGDVEDLEYFVRPGRRFAVHRCDACESEFLHPRPTEAELPDFYPSDYHAYNEDHGPIARRLVASRARARARFYAELAEGRKARLFDVGAGDCRHFDELRRTCDMEFGGVELQADVAAEARRRGYDVVTGTLETMDLTGREGQHDIVSMNHVLEHVVDPRVAVERTARLLRPAGHVIGQLPTVTSWEARLFGRRWGGYHYPRHLQMFSKRGLERLLRAAGFVDVRIRSAPHIQTAVSLQNSLVGRGWHPQMRYGKTPVYSGLLLGVLPFEAVAYAFDRGGIVNFRARTPAIDEGRLGSGEDE